MYTAKLIFALAKNSLAYRNQAITQPRNIEKEVYSKRICITAIRANIDLASN